MLLACLECFIFGGMKLIEIFLFVEAVDIWNAIRINNQLV